MSITFSNTKADLKLTDVPNMCKYVSAKARELSHPLPENIVRELAEKNQNLLGKKERVEDLKIKLVPLAETLVKAFKSISYYLKPANRQNLSEIAARMRLLWEVNINYQSRSDVLEICGLITWADRSLNAMDLEVKLEHFPSPESYKRDGREPDASYIDKLIGTM